MSMPTPTQKRWPNPAIPEWDGSIASARALQLELAQRLLLRDDFRASLRTVAGFDVGFEDGGSVTRAAAVLLDARTLAVPESTRLAGRLAARRDEPR